MPRNKNVNTTIIEGAKFLQKENTQLKQQLSTLQIEYDKLKDHAGNVSLQWFELQQENESLKEKNDTLLKALEWIEMKSYQKDEWTEIKTINDHAKQAIEQNTIK